MFEIHECLDSGLLSRLNVEIQNLHHTLNPTVFKPYNAIEIEIFYKVNLAKENCKAYVAFENNVAVGYVLLFAHNIDENPFQFAKKFVLIDQILVLQNHRKKGVGKLLLVKSYAYAKSLNINLIELNHWTTNNTARHFFNEEGFTYFNEKMFK
jgi:GNAT superfamily N-acetyltransferase